MCGCTAVGFWLQTVILVDWKYFSGFLRNAICVELMHVSEEISCRKISPLKQVDASFQCGLKNPPSLACGVGVLKDLYTNSTLAPRAEPQSLVLERFYHNHSFKITL